MAEEQETKLTRYVLCRRDRVSGLMRPEKELDARGAPAAMTAYLEHENTIPLASHEALVAIPMSNWTERGAEIKTVRDVQLVALEPLTFLEADPVEAPPVEPADA